MSEITQGWHDVGAPQDFGRDSVVRVAAGHQVLAVCHIDGVLHAISDGCTHGSGSLSEGWLLGDEIECPLHQGRFHVPSGKAVASPCVTDVRTFEVRIVDGRVQVRLEDAPP